MNIGQLARLAGVPIDTVRYYERQQLLPAPARSAAGYRRYQDGDVMRLNFIRRAKALGFTLEEIKDLLAISDARDDIAQVKAAANAKLLVVEERIAELERVRGALRGLIDACPGHGDPSTCPILGALNEAHA